MTPIPRAWLTETGYIALGLGDGPVRALPERDEDIGFTVPLFDQAAIDAAVAAEREWLRELVEAVRNANAMEGAADGTFRLPNAEQTRAWLALLSALYGAAP